MTLLSIHQIAVAPSGWTNQLYVTSDGDYMVATFKYDSLKSEDPCHLSPAGDYPID